MSEKRTLLWEAGWRRQGRRRSGLLLSNRSILRGREKIKESRQLGTGHFEVIRRIDEPSVGERRFLLRDTLRDAAQHSFPHLAPEVYTFALVDLPLYVVLRSSAQQTRPGAVSQVLPKPIMRSSLA